MVRSPCRQLFVFSFKRSLIFISVFLLSYINPASIAANEDRHETIAVIGTGYMGTALGTNLAKLGYRIIYGSRTPGAEKTARLLARSGKNASATTQKQAAQQADIIFLAVPWPAMEKVAQGLGNIDGKIVIDISMPVKQGKDGYMERLLPTSSAEMIQDWNPGAKVIKAFATQGYFVFDLPKAVDGIVSVPIAGDDRWAKERVAGIAKELGFDPVDAGPLRHAHEIEGMQMLYMVPLAQYRSTAWEFYFRRANHWRCVPEEETYDPVIDHDKLAQFPNQDEGMVPCESYSPD